jgi:hypothetical protein
VAIESFGECLLDGAVVVVEFLDASGVLIVGRLD